MAILNFEIIMRLMNKRHVKKKKLVEIAKRKKERKGNLDFL